MRFAAEARSIARALPEPERQAEQELGWHGIGDEKIVSTVLELYGGTGHSVLLKSQAGDVFANVRCVATRPKMLEKFGATSDAVITAGHTPPSR